MSVTSLLAQPIPSLFAPSPAPSRARRNRTSRRRFLGNSGISLCACGQGKTAHMDQLNMWCRKTGGRKCEMIRLLHASVFYIFLLIFSDYCYTLPYEQLGIFLSDARS
jgi:hypothetical protein